MRWIYLITILLFATAIIVFALQNLATITVSFLGFSVSTRIAILVSSSMCWAPRRGAAFLHS